MMRGRMRYVADLHLHSRFAKAVSKDMTLETFAVYARRKGVDVMGTGDILQPAWLDEAEAKLVPAAEAEGWYSLRSEIEEPLVAGLPEALRGAALRFVLSTEVHCAPAGAGEFQGIHHLLYFPSLAHARAMQARLARYGDLSEGRPVVRLASRELLALALEVGATFAPAHVMNPYFSTLGSRERHHTLEEVFGDLTPHLIAVEMGLTSIPPMCRRIDSLDHHALFACSDAHSPENIGRECTLLDTAPGYEPMWTALHRGARDEVLGCVKFSIHHTRYFLNWCAKCKVAYHAPACPRGHGTLPTGSRDWLAHIATRAEPVVLTNTPRFRMYVPLRALLAAYLQVGPTAARLDALHESLLARVGHERHILTKATVEEIARASTEDLARTIVAQRTADYRTPIQIAPAEKQPEFSL